MTSQTDATPTCSAGHGYMIPVNREFALLDEVGRVAAMITWWDSDEGPLSEVIYALNEQVLATIPRLGGDVHVGDWLYEMQQSGRAVAYHEITPQYPGLLRIDDARLEHKHGYRVYDGTVSNKHLEVGTMFYCYVDDDTDGRRLPRLSSFAEVMALTTLPEAVFIDDISSFAGKSFGDPEVIARFGDLRTAIRVQDECEIQRKLNANWTSA